MNTDIPKRTLELLSEMSPVDEHDGNGPGMIVCPACGGYAYMRWDCGRRLDSPDDVVHDSDCPAVWARRVLTESDEAQAAAALRGEVK